MVKCEGRLVTSGLEQGGGSKNVFAQRLRHSGGFRRHCWMLSALLSLFSSLFVRGRTGGNSKPVGCNLVSVDTMHSFSREELP